jgi:hypothetical protein
MSDSGAQQKLQGEPLGHHVRRMDAKSQLSELRASLENKNKKKKPMSGTSCESPWWWCPHGDSIECKGSYERASTPSTLNRRARPLDRYHSIDTT